MPESCKPSVRFGEDYSLYVTNLPLELNEDGIAKIFKEYGTVKAIIAPRGGQFAFISYATYSEAENAIRSLDGRPPLDLRVQFRRKRKEESVERHEEVQPGQFPDELSPPVPSLMEQDHVLPKTSVTYSHHASHDSPVELLRNKFPAREYSIAPAYPVMSPNFVHYPYDRIEYADTNALWTRGSLTVDAAGRRHVTMGRGHTSYNISEPRPRIINDIAKIYEIRHSGCYKYGSDQCKDYCGECMHCSRDATLCCSICEGFYCSRACQAADWPKHQEQCGKIPPLVGANSHQCSNKIDTNVPVDSQPVVGMEVKKTSQPAGKIQGEVDEKKKVPLRRPKSVVEPIPTKIVTVETPAAPTTSAVTPQAKQENTSPRVEKPASKQAVETIAASPSVPRGDNSGAKSIRNAHAMTRSNADNFLPSSSFTEVLITSVKEPGKLFFVQKIEDNPKIAELMEKLNESIQQCPSVDKPVVGEIYGVIYDNVWHRGLLLSFNPTIVDYIDWGTAEELSSSASGFKAIGSLAEPPRFSQLIKLPQKFFDKSKDLDIDAVMSVKKINVKTENGVHVINVDMFEEKTPVEEVTVAAITPAAPSATPSAKRPPSVLNSVTVGMKLVAEIAYVIDTRAVRVVVSFDAINEAFESLLTPFKDDCDGRAASCVNYEPHVDDLVAVKKPDDEYWVRGYVLKYQPPSIEIASLDEAAIITSVEKIIPLTPKYSDICIFSAIMNTSSDQSSLASLEVGSVVELDVTAAMNSKSNNDARAVVEVTMKNDQSVITKGLQLNEWTPWEVEFSKVDVTLTETPDTKINDPGTTGQETVRETNNKNNREEKDKGKVENSSSEAKRIVERVELKNNTNVMIQSYRSPSLLFLRSVEPEEIERHNRLMQTVAKCALTSSPLESLPQPAEYVLTQFEDGNYYRAMVFSSDPETKQIKVVYIDYGDIQMTTLDKLRVMPESLMNEVCCVKKVKLYGIKSGPPTEEAVLHLANAVACEEQFVYQRHSSIKDEDHVILKSTATGKSFNDQINQLLTPTWEREGKKNENCQSSAAETSAPPASEAQSTPKEQVVILQPISNSECFTLNDMATGKLGSIGETVPALFLETIQPGCKFVFGPEDTEMIVHVTSVMPEMMKKYSESSSHYIPRDNELCIALFEDGQWYRGCCFNSKATATSALVFFLDFGNLSEVLHTDIREMTRDFLKPEAFGCVCSLYDFIDPATSEVAPPVLARLETLLLQNETYKVEIVSFDGDEYQIKLPEIQSKLVEEGLLSA
ncbi:uncharacterized protein LOC107048379 [Diachasma alloeum]|uniref:uncharacterized protein LOC107048379 n=1 Tax=Diachasma alloeum TaxID=454923 RepID=UPI0007382F6A|nr:uncharacterized protein LOC107048379 [Diachasma alloeum]XP_028982623.1 uncharacterized protein LOC107048379 [Diachasma alloeum]